MAPTETKENPEMMELPVKTDRMVTAVQMETAAATDMTDRKVTVETGDMMVKTEAMDRMQNMQAPVTELHLSSSYRLQRYL